jgi:hypothetical protein
MTRQIKETDWKLLRQMHPIALDRFCQRVLSEVQSISTDNAKSFHQRYLDIFDVIQNRDKDMARTFDDSRRSTALIQLAAMRSQGLLTDDEFQRFSEETRTFIEVLLGIRRA